MTNKEAEEMLALVVAQLGEHFDAVQIMVSRQNERGTVFTKWGSGNWYARQGMAHEFIQENQAMNNANEMKNVLPPPDTDGDDWKSPK